MYIYLVTNKTGCRGFRRFLLARVLIIRYNEPQLIQPLVLNN